MQIASPILPAIHLVLQRRGLCGVGKFGWSRQGRRVFFANRWFPDTTGWSAEARAILFFHR